MARVFTAKKSLAARRRARTQYETARKTTKPGQPGGKRFKAIEAAAKAGGARDPAAVAAAVGRKAHGKKAMRRWAIAGKKAATRKRRK